MYRYEIIYVYKSPFVKHKMLRVNFNTVVHNYPMKGIQIDHLNSAKSGRDVFHDSYCHSELSPEQLIQKARLMSKNRKYWLKYNCEHFLNELLGKPIESPQLRAAMFTGIAAVCLFAFARSA